MKIIFMSIQRYVISAVETALFNNSINHNMAPLDKLNGNQLLMEYLAGGRLVFKLLSV
jgi:hypothetical protein